MYANFSCVDLIAATFLSLVNLPVNPPDTLSRQHSTESPCRTVSSRLLVMALWPTCPARGLPDTVARSSRKSKQRTIALLPPLSSTTPQPAQMHPTQRFYGPVALIDASQWEMLLTMTTPSQLPQGRPQEACPPDCHYGLQGWHDHDCPRPRPSWRQVAQEGGC